MKDVEGVGTLAQVLSAVIWPRGVNVISVIHQSDLPTRLGMSYEVSDLAGRRPGVTLTSYVDRGASTWDCSSRLIAIADRRLAIELFKRREFFSWRLRWRLRKVE